MEIPEVIETHDADIQTDAHPVETKIDPNYMWNIWDWKRQAILLVKFLKLFLSLAFSLRFNFYS